MSFERSQNSVGGREAVEESNFTRTDGALEADDGSSAKLQKKKRKDNLFDLFSEHTDIGNWADAASEPFSSMQKTDSVDEKSHVEDTSERKTSSTNHQFNTVHNDTSFHGGAASHSNCGAASEERSLQLFVSNIPWVAREEDLFYFFGGEAAVANIQLGRGSRPDWNNGSATITFNSFEACMRGREMDSRELCGRLLKIRDHRRQPLSYRENRGYSDRQCRVIDGYPPRPDGGYGGHQYHEDGFVSRVPRKNASYAGVPSTIVQNDNHSDFRRLQQNNASFRHHPVQNARPYRGRSSFGGAPLRKSPSEDGTMRSYDTNFRHIRKGSYANDGQRPPTFSQQLPPEPAHRRKLELAPRTVSVESKVEPHRSSSIFGEAKPVDTSRKEREAEERLDREDRVTRTSRSRKGSSEVNLSHPTTPTLPSVASGGNGALQKTTNVLERQLSETHVGTVEGKVVQVSAAKPPLPPPPPQSIPLADASAKENHIPVLTAETTHIRKMSSGAPILMHSQSLPPLPKAHSRENVHEGYGGAGAPSKPILVFTNSSLKSKAYSGRRSERGRERSQYNGNSYHDGGFKYSSDNVGSQRFRVDSVTRENRSGRRGSVSSVSKEKYISSERRRSIAVSKPAENEERQRQLLTGVVDAKPKETLEKPEETNLKSVNSKLKDGNSRNKKGKAVTNKEKKKTTSGKSVPKLNVKPSVVSTTNKFAALLETNE